MIYAPGRSGSERLLLGWPRPNTFVLPISLRCGLAASPYRAAAGPNIPALVHRHWIMVKYWKTQHLLRYRNFWRVFD
jgi:hypothetical protein